MICRMSELRCKEVINVRDGIKLGYVDDVEIDGCSAAVVSVVIFGKSRFFGLFGREDDIVIPWDDIKVIGSETVLVNTEAPPYLKQKIKKF